MNDYNKVKFLQETILKEWNKQVKPHVQFLSWKTTCDAKTREEAERVAEEIKKKNLEARSFREKYDLAMNEMVELYYKYENVKGPEYQLFLAMSYFLQDFIGKDRKMEKLNEQIESWYKINIENRKPDNQFTACVNIDAVEF